jgi:hypothetical protein
VSTFIVYRKHVVAIEHANAVTIINAVVLLSPSGAQLL